MPSRREIRHANIGIAVGAVVLAVGGFVFHDAGDGPLQAVGLVGLASALVVSHALEALANRRERSKGQKPQ